MSLTAESITYLLQNPQSLKGSDGELLANTLRDAPYFLPARWLQDYLHVQQDGLTDKWRHDIQLRDGNLILFAEWLQASTYPDTREAEHQNESVAEKANATEQPVQHLEKTAAGPATQPAPEQQKTAADNSPDTDTNPTLPAAEAELTADAAAPPYIPGPSLSNGFQTAQAIAPKTPESATEETAAINNLMIMRSFAGWLEFFRKQTTGEREEDENKKLLKAKWQKDKLASVQKEDEADEIPPQVFEMAVNSISIEDALISESLAEILMSQGKLEKAIEMYKKLSLRNPDKSIYFAQQIQKIQQENAG